MARKKPLPTRRGRGKPDEGDAEGLEAASDEGLEAVEAAPVARSGMGIDMALIVVTLVALVVAFLMLQVEMRSAFGEGWPV